MKSLRIEGGDLVIGAHGYDEVEGQAKTLQDLGIALREPFGSDIHHPQWGSLLDSYIGQPSGTGAEGIIRSEVARVVRVFMLNQQRLIAADASTGRKSRLTSQETINRLLGINVAQDLDALQVKISLETLSKDNVSLVNTTVR